MIREKTHPEFLKTHVFLILLPFGLPIIVSPLLYLSLRHQLIYPCIVKGPFLMTFGLLALD